VRQALSLRWRLILLAGALASCCAVALTIAHYFYARRELLGQLEKTLATKCDEVITVLQRPTAGLTLSEFLWIETHYRSTPYTYFYQVSDSQGRLMARSGNLADHTLPMPTSWEEGSKLDMITKRIPGLGEAGPVRIRSERARISAAGGTPQTFLIQTAVTMAPLEAAAQRDLVASLAPAAAGLTGVFFLLWLVTTRALRRVAAITTRASQISAANPRQRLPMAGSGDELDKLSHVLNDMLDRLGRSLEQMEQFSSDAAHQLRAPLTRIRGELDLLLGGDDLSGERRGQLEGIREDVERMSRLCGRLLLLARLDQRAAEGALFSEQVDLESVVADLLDQMAPVAQERRVDLRRSATSATSVPGSRPLLAEAILNLLDNAIRHSVDGGVVEVSLERHEAQVWLSIRDSGPGIPPEEHEKIFRRFYRMVGPPEGSVDGSGLGLAIVAMIARAHGGRVELDSAPGSGSVFRLVLPVVPPAPGSAAPSASKPTAIDRPAAARPA